MKHRQPWTWRAHRAPLLSSPVKQSAVTLWGWGTCTKENNDSTHLEAPELLGLDIAELRDSAPDCLGAGKNTDLSQDWPLGSLFQNKCQNIFLLWIPSQKWKLTDAR